MRHMSGKVVFFRVRRAGSKYNDYKEWVIKIFVVVVRKVYHDLHLHCMLIGYSEYLLNGA